jgi:hypothetical protein
MKDVTIGKYSSAHNRIRCIWMKKKVLILGHHTNARLINLYRNTKNNIFFNDCMEIRPPAYASHVMRLPRILAKS